ncbi:MAG: UDP-N-acetylglucosamine--N-acetylmuramyl-(pentapeptide) pyrophosphoryl-undecaprenol N-acetylglucosamine transferase [Ruminiclostridium sp.]|nr:UDP-N-acetylglucosamine--N-acetylmuramyl-(pentapeptide) pyrophosphoryl-undecaprenol N-acetylglucosamine transferase [Ruminiclostridium sp.]
MRVILAAGGTAGHINPALAIADKIKHLFPDAVIKFVGAQGGMEEKLVRKAGYDFTAFRMAGLQRKLTPQNIKRNIQAVHYYITARGDAHKLIKEFAPDIAIGTGGYVCAPVLTVAAKMGVKTAVHESNSLPGITTTMLSPRVDKVLCANEDVITHLKHTENCVVTGNPIRSNIPIEDRNEARKKLGLPEGMTIVSFGGSLGANKISEAVAALVKWEREVGDINHIHSYGGNGKDMFDGLLKDNGLETGERFIAREYIDNMYTCLSAADLIISRAGAMTLTELKAAGRASILIPFPQAAENHQYYNALTMSKNGAAILIEDKDLSAERLLAEVQALYNDRGRLTEMEKAASALNIPNATDLVVGNILDLIKD